MENMEYIDDYFSSSPGDEEKQQFEQRIINDSSFAADVAYYLSVHTVLKEQSLEEKKHRFRKIYEQQKVVPITRQPFRKIMRYMAAACLVAAVLLFGWLFQGNKTAAPELADTYIQQNLKTLRVTMGREDSLQMGLGLYNQGNFTEALNIFEAIIQRDSANDAAKTYAGIASLRLGRYDAALSYFSLLASYTSRFSNPGMFYEALTLLKRNEKGDIVTAKKLLEEVVAKDLEGKMQAAEWLKRL